MEFLNEIGARAKEAKYDVQKYTTAMKNEALIYIADKLVACSEEILEANKKDIEKAKDNGIHDGMIDRLSLSVGRIEAMAVGLKQIAELPDYIGQVMEEFSHEKGLNEDSVILIENTDREVTAKFMKMKEYVDVLNPRGGAGLIRAVVENSTIPVIETGTGNCHIYIDDSADLTKVVKVVNNAKTQRISVCNACESLVVHKNMVEKVMPLLKEAMNHANVEFRCDETSIAYTEGALAASEADFGTEYLDYILSVKTVENVEEAVAHINKYNTGHSDAIITENTENAEYFLNNVDAACVYVNASTRFTDGFEFGFGAEIGISTQKLHARGPMGLRELTAYKYQIIGNGEIRG